MKNQIEQFKSDVANKNDNELRAWLNSLKAATPADQSSKEVNDYMKTYIEVELAERSGELEATSGDTVYVLTQDIDVPQRGGGFMRYVAGQTVKGEPTPDGSAITVSTGDNIPMAYLKVMEIERKIDETAKGIKVEAMRILGSRNAYIAVSWGAAAALIGLLFGRNMIKTAVGGAIAGLAYEHFLIPNGDAIPDVTRKRIEAEEAEIQANARGRGAGYQDIRHGGGSGYKTARVPEGVPDGSPCTIGGQSGTVSGGLCYVGGGGVTNKGKGGGRRAYQPVKQPRHRNRPAFRY